MFWILIDHNQVFYFSCCAAGFAPLQRSVVRRTSNRPLTRILEKEDSGEDSDPRRHQQKQENDDIHRRIHSSQRMAVRKSRHAQANSRAKKGNRLLNMKIDALTNELKEEKKTTAIVAANIFKITEQLNELTAVNRSHKQS